MSKYYKHLSFKDVPLVVLYLDSFNQKCLGRAYVCYVLGFGPWDGLDFNVRCRSYKYYHYEVCFEVDRIMKDFYKSRAWHVVKIVMDCDQAFKSSYYKEAQEKYLKLFDGGYYE